MNEPRIRIRFDADVRTYRPGQTLSGEYQLDAILPNQIKCVEVSVLWYSEGKGDEDLAVHDFQRLSREEGDFVDTGRPGRFSTTLPNSPLSYEGAIVKLCWCVRVRVLMERGKDLVGELPFELGNVPAANGSPQRD